MILGKAARNLSTEIQEDFLMPALNYLKEFNTIPSLMQESNKYPFKLLNKIFIYKMWNFAQDLW